MKNKLTRIFQIFIYFCCIIVAFSLHRYSTINGIGISPDSVTYIETATSLLDGKGFFVGENPMTHYPPVYPLILSVSGILFNNIAQGALFLATFFYIVNACLFGTIIYLSTNRNLIALVIGLITFLSSKSILHVHSYAWSEPPFIMFILISLLLLRVFVINKKISWLILASLSIGLAITTRYVGIALIPTITIFLLLLVYQPLRTRLIWIFSSLIIILLPILSWIIRNLIIAHTATNRIIVFHPFGLDRIKQLILTLHGLVLETSGLGVVNTVELLFVCSVIAYMIYENFKTIKSSDLAYYHNFIFSIFGILLSTFYIVVVILTISLVDAATPFDERILTPVYIFTFVCIFSIVLLFSINTQIKWVWLVFIIMVLFSIRSNLSSLINLTTNFHNNGIGYNSIAWNNSSTLKQLEMISGDSTVYSNGADVIKFKTGIEAISIPGKISPNSRITNPTYYQSLLKMCDHVNSGKAILVYFKEITWRGYFPLEEEIVNECLFSIISENNDGTIYGREKP